MAAPNHPLPMPKKPSLFLFHGEDSYSSSEKIKIWRNQFAKKYNDDMNIALLDGEKLTASRLKSDIEAFPFLAEKRLTIIYNFLSQGKTGEQKTVAQELENTPDFSIVVFHETTPPDKRLTLYKKLVKIATIEEFKTPEGLILNRWIEKKAAGLSARFNQKALSNLVNLVGPNLWQLDNEIKKLALFCRNRPISPEDVQKLVSQNFSASIFTLTDAISRKNPKTSLNTLNDLVESGEDIPRVFHMIVRHFRILIQVKDLMNGSQTQQEITTFLKEHPYTVKNAMAQARNFTPALLTGIYRQLLAIEIAMKSGKIKLLADDQRDLILALEKLILKLCR